MEGRFFPEAGIVIALVTAGVMIAAGADAWLLAALPAWIGALWTSRGHAHETE